MKRFAEIVNDIEQVEKDRVENTTAPMQEQINESPDAPPAAMTFAPNDAMTNCIRSIQFNVIPWLTSGQFRMSSEMVHLYTNLIRCITEYEHSAHAIRSILMLRSHEQHFQAKDKQMFGILTGQQLQSHDERRMSAFKEVTYLLNEMCKLKSVRQSGADGWLTQLADKCEHALGTDVNEYGL